MNRRLKTEQGYRISPNPDGPVDHDVPVLRIDNPDAGFAQLYLEEAHPEVTALFIAGCGGDQNPYPRRTLALAQQHGRALANGVETALLSRASPSARAGQQGASTKEQLRLEGLRLYATGYRL